MDSFKIFTSDVEPTVLLDLFLDSTHWRLYRGMSIAKESPWVMLFTQVTCLCSICCSPLLCVLLLQPTSWQMTPFRSKFFPRRARLHFHVRFVSFHILMMGLFLSRVLESMRPFTSSRIPLV